ncbi:Hypothetical predicted protein [Olea europaea subsp. europaea]|uniref:Uncharacterized protein n=1 Tax=Olea europaea subsp. europaea TaxID=158383 RepID=A0A8S0T8W2_OLEEU|nr:Hypothetical predicted protein [Olea europaea subsp. europaea]
MESGRKVEHEGRYGGCQITESERKVEYDVGNTDCRILESGRMVERGRGKRQFSNCREWEKLESGRKLEHGEGKFSSVELWRLEERLSTEEELLSVRSVEYGGGNVGCRIVESGRKVEHRGGGNVCCRMVKSWRKVEHEGEKCGEKMSVVKLKIVGEMLSTKVKKMSVVELRRVREKLSTDEKMSVV